MKNISQRILTLITEQKITYAELSKKTKMPASALQRYAVGDTSKIPLDRIVSIAAALGTTPEYLMGWDSDERGAERVRVLEENFAKKYKLELNTDEKITALYLDGKQIKENELELLKSVLRVFRNGK